MRWGTLRAMVFSLLAGALSCGVAHAAGVDLGAKLDPVGSARGKIDEARRLLLTQRPLDVTKFAVLISDAHKQAPVLDKSGAEVVRRAAILFFGNEKSTQTLGWIDFAVTLNPTLAFDDTLQRMCNFFGEQPPTMARHVEARRVAEEKKNPKPKETKVVVVPYVALPEGVVRPVNSPICGGCVSRTSPDYWPRVLERVSPNDPRGAGAPKATVQVTALIDRNGRVASVEDAAGPEELKAVASAAVRQWAFRPLTYLGVAMPTTASIEVPFGADAPTSTGSKAATATSTTDGLPKFGDYVYVEELPEAISRVPPAYEGAAKDKNISGTVLVQVLVGPDGMVKDTRVTKSIPELDDAAVAAARQWRFKPALAGGKPVAVWVAVPMRFPPN